MTATIEPTTTDAAPSLDELSFEELAARVDELRDQVKHADHHAQELLEATIEAVTAFNRAGLVELIQVLRSDPRGEELLFAAVDKPEVMALLVQHGVVRVDRTLDVLRTIDQLRPYLAASSIEMEVVRVEGDVVTVAFAGGCSAPSEQTKAEILSVIGTRLPGMTAVEQETGPKGQAFVPVTSLRIGPP